MLSTLIGPYVPGRRANDRIPNFPPNGRTGLTGTVNTFTLTGPQASAINLTTKRMIQTRDPVLPLFYDYINTNYTNAGVLVTYDTDTGWKSGLALDSTAEITDINMVTTAASTGTSALPGITGTVQQPYSNMGSNYWPSMTDPQLTGNPFFWLPDNWSYTFLVHNVAAANAILGFVTFEVWDGPGAVSAVISSFSTSSVYGAAGGAYYSDGNPAWVRMRAVNITSAGNSAADTNVKASMYISAGAATVTFLSSSVTITSAQGATVGTGVCMLPVPESLPAQTLATVPSMLTSVVMHSSNLQFENVTKVLNKEGTMQAARLRYADRARPFAASASTIAIVDPRKRYMGALEHGVRGYVEPGASVGTPREHLFTYLTTAGVRQILPTMVIRSEDIYNLYSITDSDVTTVSTFSVSLSQGWEYVSNSYLFETDVCRTTTPVLERAIVALQLRNPFTRLEGGRGQELAPRRPPQAPRQPRRPRKARPPPPKPPQPRPKMRSGLDMYLKSRAEPRKKAPTPPAPKPQNRGRGKGKK